MQDTEQTEDILERLRTGRSTRWKGRDRVVSCLDEDDDLVNFRDSESLDKISFDSQTGADGPFAEEDHIEEPSISLQQRTRSQDLETDCLLDEYEDNEDIAREEPVIDDEIFEDEEEHEQSIKRKRLLEESVSYILKVAVSHPCFLCISTTVISRFHLRLDVRLHLQLWFTVDSFSSCNRRNNLVSCHPQKMRALEKC